MSVTHSQCLQLKDPRLMEATDGGDLHAYPSASSLPSGSKGRSSSQFRAPSREVE